MRGFSANSLREVLPVIITMSCKRFSHVLFLALSLFVDSGGLLAAGKGVADNYRLGTGDSIRIQVFQEDDLTLETRISDAGTISYPLLGTMRVKGLTIAQLEDRITSGLQGDYLVSPRVNVSIVGYRQFFVNGEVKKPGAYPYVPGLTVRKAISIAGGFEERADKENLKVLHENNLKGKPARVNIDDKVRPGDILTVEQSFF